MAKITLFSQIFQRLPKDEIKKTIREHGTDKHSKGFNTWTHFVSLVFCQFADYVSLRDIRLEPKATANAVNLYSSPVPGIKKEDLFGLLSLVPGTGLNWLFVISTYWLILFVLSFSKYSKYSHHDQQILYNMTKLWPTYSHLIISHSPAVPSLSSPSCWMKTMVCRGLSMKHRYDRRCCQCRGSGRGLCHTASRR